MKKLFFKTILITGIALSSLSVFAQPSTQQNEINAMIKQLCEQPQQINDYQGCVDAVKSSLKTLQPQMISQFVSGMLGGLKEPFAKANLFVLSEAFIARSKDVQDSINFLSNPKSLLASQESLLLLPFLQGKIEIEQIIGMSEVDKQAFLSKQYPNGFTEEDYEKLVTLVQKNQKNASEYYRRIVMNRVDAIEKIPGDFNQIAARKLAVQYQDNLLKSLYSKYTQGAQFVGGKDQYVNYRILQTSFMMFSQHFINNNIDPSQAKKMLNSPQFVQSINQVVLNFLGVDIHPDTASDAFNKKINDLQARIKNGEVTIVKDLMANDINIPQPSQSNSVQYKN